MVILLLITLTLPALLLFLGSRWTLHFQPYSGRFLRRRLPPGSMGWPYVGETLKFYTQHPTTFFSTRRTRYGEIFKSHILGCPCVMISSPEAIKMVLGRQAHLFKPTYPPSKEKLIGPNALFFHQGHYHSTLKKLVQSSFQPSAIKGSVPDIENIVLDFLSRWEIRSRICTLHEMKQYSFEVAMLSVLGNNKEPEIGGMRGLYQTLEKGYNSMPLDFPGTSFHKAMKARETLNKTMMRVIEKRCIRRREDEENGGLVEAFVRGKEWKDEEMADNIIGVIFAAQDTTASILTWLLKYLHDNPNILEAVTMEQTEIQRKQDRIGLTWEDTRRMFMTTRVIEETLRSASILSFTFREAMEDVEFEGYLIPKGWKVLPLFRQLHHSPRFFPRPHVFDPSRFEVSGRMNTYMPFGHGAHSCPGSELAKLEMLILLHHLTTTYRWRVIGEEDDGVEYSPFPVPKGGLPIQLYKTSKDSKTKDCTSVY